MVLVVKYQTASVGDVRDVGSIPGWGRSPGGGHGSPLKYSCLESHGQKRLAGSIGSIGLYRVRHDWSDLARRHADYKANIPDPPPFCTTTPFKYIHSKDPALFQKLVAFTTTAAKSLQLCLTLCDPIDGSPPGSPVPGILQARTLEWVAISFSNASKWKVKGKSLSRVRLFTTPWTAAHQTPPSMGFSRQEYWSGLPLPSPLGREKKDSLLRMCLHHTKSMLEKESKVGPSLKKKFSFQKPKVRTWKYKISQ